MKTSNNYRVSGSKMTSRFGLSHAGERHAVKAGVIPSATEVKAYGREADVSAKWWSKLQRMSLRQLRVLNKGLPMYDMDGSYYHG